MLGPKGRRTVEIAKFFKSPASATDREHTLAPNEMVLDVTIPVRPCPTPATRCATSKPTIGRWCRPPSLSRRPQRRQGDECQDRAGPRRADAACRGSRRPRPGRASDHRGQRRRRRRAAAEGAKPLSQNAYKVKLVEVAVKRALLIAAGMKRYWEA